MKNKTLVVLHGCQKMMKAFWLVVALESLDAAVAVVVENEAMAV
jgi:hypothetical protein